MASMLGLSIGARDQTGSSGVVIQTFDRMLTIPRWDTARTWISNTIESTQLSIPQRMSIYIFLQVYQICVTKMLPGMQQGPSPSQLMTNGPSMTNPSALR
jgi:hypothetical protein